MKVSYYPGCTLKTKAKDLDRYARLTCEALGVTLEEIEDWQCCGGVFTGTHREIATKLSAARALEDAKRHGQKLVTVCSACHNVIKQTNHQIKTNEGFAQSLNQYARFDEPYLGETQVLHLLELLRDEVGYDVIKEKVTDRLKGKKIAPYYGCLLLRPSGIMQMDDPENPTIMEDLIRAMGAEPVVYAYRNECCGGYVVLENPASSEKKSQSVVKNAKMQGAEMIVTACPLCKYNLEKHNDSMPIVYITELLAEALGIKEAE